MSMDKATARTEENEIINDDAKSSNEENVSSSLPPPPPPHYNNSYGTSKQFRRGRGGGNRGGFSHRPPYDLRNVLNNKRQGQPPVSNDPPPDPRNNFLSDPDRDDVQNFERNTQYGSARYTKKYPNTNYDNKQQQSGRSSRPFSSRSRGGGGGSNFRRPQRSRSLDGDTPEWHDRQSDGEMKTKFYQNQTQPRRGGYAKYTENTSGCQFRRYHQDQDHQQHQHQPSNRRGQRGGAGSGYRGGHNYGRPNPVRITVECNTVTGERICTAERMSRHTVPTKHQNQRGRGGRGGGAKRSPNRAERTLPPPLPDAPPQIEQCENWDADEEEEKPDSNERKNETNETK